MQFFIADEMMNQFLTDLHNIEIIQGLDFLAGSEDTYYDTQDVQRYVFWYIV